MAHIVWKYVQPHLPCDVSGEVVIGDRKRFCKHGRFVSDKFRMTDKSLVHYAYKKPYTNQNFRNIVYGYEKKAILHKINLKNAKCSLCGMGRKDGACLGIYKMYVNFVLDTAYGRAVPNYIPYQDTTLCTDNEFRYVDTHLNYKIWGRKYTNYYIIFPLCCKHTIDNLYDAMQVIPCGGFILIKNLSYSFNDFDAIREIKYSCCNTKYKNVEYSVIPKKHVTVCSFCKHFEMNNTYLSFHKYRICESCLLNSIKNFDLSIYSNFLNLIDSFKKMVDNNPLLQILQDVITTRFDRNMRLCHELDAYVFNIRDFTNARIVNTYSNKLYKQGYACLWWHNFNKFFYERVLILLEIKGYEISQIHKTQFLQNCGKMIKYLKISLFTKGLVKYNMTTKFGFERGYIFGTHCVF